MIYSLLFYISKQVIPIRKFDMLSSKNYSTWVDYKETVVNSYYF